MTSFETLQKDDFGGDFKEHFNWGVELDFTRCSNLSGHKAVIGHFILSD